MKVKFENDRLEMIPEDNYEERFAKKLQQLINAVSNEFMAWYGDVEFGEQKGGFIITWKPGKNPRELTIEKD